MTYTQARAHLPDEAFLSSSFGNPGCGGGYSEIWRAPDGRRWMIDNGKWCDDGQTWSLQTIE
jgi:hypothetical protein